MIEQNLSVLQCCLSKSSCATNDNIWGFMEKLWGQLGGKTHQSVNHFLSLSYEVTLKHPSVPEGGQERAFEGKRGFLNQACLTWILGYRCHFHCQWPPVQKMLQGIISFNVYSSNSPNTEIILSNCQFSRHFYLQLADYINKVVHPWLSPYPSPTPVQTRPSTFPPGLSCGHLQTCSQEKKFKVIDSSGTLCFSSQAYKLNGGQEGVKPLMAKHQWIPGAGLIKYAFNPRTKLTAIRIKIFSRWDSFKSLFLHWLRDYWGMMKSKGLKSD